MDTGKGAGNPFETDLTRNEANYTPLSPLSFIERTAAVFPHRPSIIHGARRYTWAETYSRCRRLAAALTGRGVALGDTVAVMAANTPELFESHFGVPMTGAVLNTLNVRMDSNTIAYCLDHGEARVLLADTEFHDTIKAALEILGRDILVIDIADSEIEPDFGADSESGNAGRRLGETDYETFLEEGDPGFDWRLPEDEWQAISLNYTSGTTGRPKGVVYHHRGAYLNGLGNVISWNMAQHPVYLWTLPMFHCNGWCFPWTMAVVAGTSVCLRKVDAANIYAAIADHGVTHFCGAPIVLNMVINATDAERRDFGHTVQIMTAAAPPPAATLEKIERAGFHVTHAYGLTETYGPAVSCAWHEEWNSLTAAERAAKKSRQGVGYHVLQGLTVMNPDTMTPVPADAETIGEVMFRGNIVMKGYLKDPSATEKSMAGGWFHSGDLAVMHPDGYIQIKDRSKDIIISGGENISSIEVEDALYKHPAVMTAAVVAKPDEKWGETPCAFVELKIGAQVTAEEIIAFCRDNLAHYKCPRHVVFGPVPKTSTGKIQKFKLREKVAGN